MFHMILWNNLYTVIVPGSITWRLENELFLLESLQLFSKHIFVHDLFILNFIYIITRCQMKIHKLYKDHENAETVG